MTINTDVQTALEWRYAVKQFDASKTIDASDWNTLENALHLSPSSFGIQPWQFIVVQDKTLRSQLRAASWNQSQVEDASHFVVLTAKKTMDVQYIDAYLNRIVEVRGVDPSSLDGYRNMILGKASQPSQAIESWTQRQVYIAMGMLLATAAMLKIDTCPLEGLSSADYDRLLNLTDTDYTTVAAVALGYRDIADKYSLAKKVRFDKESIIHYR